MRIGHVHLKVSNLDVAKIFYQDLLSAEVTEEVAGQYVFLTMGPMHHEIALQSVPKQSSRRTKRWDPGLYHSAFEADSVSEFLRCIRYLEQNSCPHALVDHGISWALYTEDPDENGVEVYLDMRASRKGTTVWSGQSRRLDRDRVEEYYNENP